MVNKHSAWHGLHDDDDGLRMHNSFSFLQVRLTNLTGLELGSLPLQKTTYLTT